MYIIIAGAGLVGGTLAEKMLESKHDVVVIDQDKETCDRLYAKIGVVAVNGSVTSVNSLREAGIRKADVTVAATESDTDNLAFAILCKSFDVPHVIARMRNPEYEKAYNLAGVDAVLRVTDLLVNQMMVEIDHPHAQRMTTIGGGKGSICRVVIPENAYIAGQTVADIVERNDFPRESLFLAKLDKENREFSIARGKHVINAGDELFFVSRNEDIQKIIDILIKKKKRRKVEK